MSQQVLCPKCSARVSIADKQQGTRVQCPVCQQPFSTAAPLNLDFESANESPVDQADWLDLDDLPEESSSAAGESPGVEQFRIRCPACESILYVRVDQAGSTTRCSDCHSRIRVPRPPRKIATPSSPPAREVDAGKSVKKSAKFDNSERSADELLKSAEDSANDEAKQQVTYRGGVTGWSGAVAGIFADPGVLLHLFVLSIFFSVPVGVTVWDTRYGFATFPFIAISASVAMSSGLAIVQAVANAETSVDEWPTMDLFVWLESCLIVGSALICSVTPSLFIATLFSAGTLVTVSLMLLGAHLVFPYTLLSILETQSIFAPVSLDVARGWKRCKNDCRDFYLIAGILLALAPSYFAAVPTGPVTAGIGAVLCVLVTFLYSAMLGRLAFALREAEDRESVETETTKVSR